VLARFCAQASFPATQDSVLRSVVADLIRSIDFPIVLTDAEGLPRAWKSIDVDPSLVSAESLDSLDVGWTISPITLRHVERVRRAVARLDRRNTPILMTRVFPPDTLGAVHYGDPHVLDVLRWTPYVTVGGTALLLLVGLGGLAAIRQAEKRSIWVGMAKETAHQLGTPLSSLMGWTHALRGWLPQPASGEARIPAAELAETIDEIERDVERLSKVAQRFSNVGSEPRLQVQDPTPVVRDVVSYMRKRLPQSRVVELRERYVDVPRARLHPELLAWALENLLSNAFSALDKPHGAVEVVLQPAAGGREIEILVADTGRGMTAREQRRAFDPGYTTRRRGWGLGLPLARRVVEDYHGGRIAIRGSTPGEGTTMVIRLPVTRESGPA
jgi:hypothetical protein